MTFNIEQIRESIAGFGKDITLSKDIRGGGRLDDKKSKNKKSKIIDQILESLLPRGRTLSGFIQQEFPPSREVTSFQIREKLCQRRTEKGLKFVK